MSMMSSLVSLGAVRGKNNHHWDRDGAAGRCCVCFVCKWGDFSAFMDARARVLESDSWEVSKTPGPRVSVSTIVVAAVCLQEKRNIRTHRCMRQARSALAPRRLSGFRVRPLLTSHDFWCCLLLWGMCFVFSSCYRLLLVSQTDVPCSSKQTAAKLQRLNSHALLFVLPFPSLR